MPGPLLLTADSQLLFGAQALTLARLLSDRGAPANLSGAYLGASNGEEAAFFELFEGAMAGLGIGRVRHVRTPPSAEEREFLAAADLVLLSGGDPSVGWARLEGARMLDVIRARHAAGAILVGTSAGAMHLGRDGLALVDALVDVHDGPAWGPLAARMGAVDPGTVGVGIPAGGGLLVTEDGWRALRRPVEIFTATATGVARVGLVPDDAFQ